MKNRGGARRRSTVGNQVIGGVASGLPSTTTRAGVSKGTVKKKLTGAAVPLLKVAALLGLALALHAPDFVITDPDAYYHLRHAWIYRTDGPLHSTFPWAQVSMIHKLGADLWYGFHILLVPLTWMSDLTRGIHIGAVGVTFGALLLFYLTMRRLEVAMALGWAVALAVASGDLAFRLTMLRPHPLSFGLTLLIFALLNAPPRTINGPVSRQWLPLFAAAALLTWLHLALAWVPLLVLVVVAAVTLLLERRWIGKARVLALVSGLVVGWLVRPAAPGAARLAWIQIVEFQRAKILGAIQDIGHELKPLDASLFIAQLVPLTVVFAIGTVVALASKRDRSADVSRVSTLSAFVLAAGFLGLAFGSARRATEFFVGFAVLFVAQVATDLMSAPTAGPRRRREPSAAIRTAVTVLIAAVFAFAGLRSWSVVKEYQQLVARAFAPERFRDTGAWLSEHARGQVALNVHWDCFGPLFFWSPGTYYVNGMDPIFEYAYDPRLHRIHYLLATDAVDAFATEEGRRRAQIDKDLRRLIIEDFGASSFITTNRRTPRLVRYLLSTQGFEIAHLSGQEIVLRVR